jgi:acetyltransferase
MGKMVAKSKKPIVLHSLYSSEKPHSLHLLRYYGIPVYDSLDVACKSMGVLAQYGNYLKSYHAKSNFVLNWGAKAKAQGNRLIAAARAEKRAYLLEPEAKALLALHDVPVPAEGLAHSVEEALALAGGFSGKAVLKIVSPDILHKSDAGGVRVNLEGPAAIASAYAEILDNARRYNPRAEIRGVLVSPMAREGMEVIIGTKRDDQFGPVIMFGLGGVLVEILKDVAFRVLPISHLSAEKMIAEIKSAPLLDGFRGIPACDKKALRKLLVKCSEIIEAYPDIQEMDLNPVISHEKGLSIVDARIILTAEP